MTPELVAALDRELGTPGRLVRQRVPDLVQRRRADARVAPPPGRFRSRCRRGSRTTTSGSVSSTSWPRAATRARSRSGPRPGRSPRSGTASSASPRTATTSSPRRSRRRGDRAARARARALRARRPRQGRRRVGDDARHGLDRPPARPTSSIPDLSRSPVAAGGSSRSPAAPQDLRRHLVAPGWGARQVEVGGERLAVDRTEGEVGPPVLARERLRQAVAREEADLAGLERMARSARRRSSGSGTRASTAGSWRSRAAGRRAPR